MLKKNARPASTPCFIEPLEGRQMLSATVASSSALTVSAGSALFGTPVTLTTTVRAASGSTKGGIIEFLDLSGKKYVTFSTATISHTGHASITFPATGGNALYVGAYTFKTRFLGTSTVIGSISRLRDVDSTVPSLTTLSDGTEYGVIQAGTGSTTAQTGDNLTMDYSGYLESNGSLFDDSNNHPTSDPFPFTLGGNVIEGWNSSIVGMKVGETRVLVIPAADAYGANPPTGSGIPANADLVFLVHLVANTGT